ncbi:MAG: 1,4-alpha-glucan branching protein GlgB [Candidatus Solibacter usitatus]|nr:1,4-alpha-glucan branching protein GlgB [Candidatus Solibacter usitatus]
MTKADIEAIVGGYHGDPFSILGPHSLRKKAGQARWEVRAFLPHAESVVVRVGELVCPMVKRHPQGFFAAMLDGDPQPYRLHAALYNNTIVEFDDPYRFPPLLTSFELHLHGEGTHYESYNTLGAHLTEVENVRGVRFAVWAPNAETVSVAGDFNQWDSRRHPMRLRDGGVWEIFMPDVGEGAAYKYYIRSRLRGYQQWKADPYAFYCETPPKSASVVRDISKYEWQDSAWMEARAGKDWLRAPMSIYEVHLESWLRASVGGALSFRELEERLVGYLTRMCDTHVELMPLMEHPFSGSWGYQVVGYYAPTSRFGTPEDFMYFIDCCHQHGIGVIMDWVPAHFPKDAHGLGYFDGSALYEHEDPRLGEHRDWGTLIFNFGRNEVRDFLISNALFWLKKYHIDGLRVDAVASMIYLDYSRKAGEWVPNQYGGNENLEALNFLRRFNELAHAVPGAFTVAEESTAFAGVSRPVYLNGLGFTLKWNMGWMHDMLHYFSQDPLHRKYHHNDITFSLLYAFTENFLLPISHDEVVHGKKSLIDKMPGDEWQRFANVRAFLAYMFGHPGKKLLFMGCDIGQYEEWNHNASVRWELLQYDYHRKLQTMVAELNLFYQAQPAMYEVDFHHTGFDWVDFRDMDHSVIAFLRKARDPRQNLLFCCNFTPVVHQGYEFAVPEPGFYEEVFNSDWARFGGSDAGNAAGVASRPSAQRANHGISITLPPLSVVAFQRRA